MFPFETPSTFSISGTTGSGKTTWLFNVLKHQNVMFGNNPPSHILYCYGIWQDLFNEMEKCISNISFHKGLPQTEQIENLGGNQHNIVVLDDLMSDCIKNPDIENLFTRGAHHQKISVIYLNQNMFCQGKHARTISLNCHYLILFQNLRDSSQIQRLGQQIFPGQGYSLLESYIDSLQDPFGYLVIDLSPYTDHKFRIRTKIFPWEETIIFRSRGLCLKKGGEISYGAM